MDIYSVWPLAGPVRVLAGQWVLMSFCGSLGRYVGYSEFVLHNTIISYQNVASCVNSLHILDPMECSSQFLCVSGSHSSVCVCVGGGGGVRVKQYKEERGLYKQVQAQ